MEWCWALAAHCGKGESHQLLTLNRRIWGDEDGAPSSLWDRGRGSVPALVLRELLQLNLRTQKQRVGRRGGRKQVSHTLAENKSYVIVPGEKLSHSLLQTSLRARGHWGTHAPRTLPCKDSSSVSVSHELAPQTCQASPALGDTVARPQLWAPVVGRRAALPYEDALHFTKEEIQDPDALTQPSPIPEFSFLISVKTFQASLPAAGQTPPLSPSGYGGPKTCQRSGRPTLRVAEPDPPASL